MTLLKRLALALNTTRVGGVGITTLAATAIITGVDKAAAAHLPHGFLGDVARFGLDAIANNAVPIMLGGGAAAFVGRPPGVTVKP